MKSLTKKEIYLCRDLYWMLTRSNDKENIIRMISHECLSILMDYIQYFDKAYAYRNQHTDDALMREAEFRREFTP